MPRKLASLPVDSIKPDPNQPRREFDEASLKELAADIKANGLIQPIEVDANRMIIYGERRWRAHKLAGLKTIKAFINTDKMSKSDRTLRQLKENIHQGRMNPVDVAHALYNIAQELGINIKSAHKIEGKPTGIKKLADAVNKNLEYVKDMMQLYFESDEVKEDIRKGTPYTYYRQAHYIKDKELQSIVRNSILSGKVSRRDDIEMIKNMAKVDVQLARETANRQRGSEQANSIYQATDKMVLTLIKNSMKNMDARDKHLVLKTLKGLRDQIDKYMAKV